MVILVIMAGLVIFLMFAGSSEDTSSKTCDALNEPHKWVYKDNLDGNHYLACSVCKMLPGGDMEESDDNSN